MRGGQFEDFSLILPIMAQLSAEDAIVQAACGLCKRQGNEKNQKKKKKEKQGKPELREEPCLFCLTRLFPGGLTPIPEISAD